MWMWCKKGERAGQELSRVKKFLFSNQQSSNLNNFYQTPYLLSGQLLKARGWLFTVVGFLAMGQGGCEIYGWLSLIFVHLFVPACLLLDAHTLHASINNKKAQLEWAEMDRFFSYK
ncbi:hypothetical protein T10_8958 [Trichinella papuae]|uniref:Uncharacterized protein n=1 Tax=Trichinella papuae TaxID=268474 RepID=A0A0V1N1L1_9BILA|nr:hypothetical protein T10_8958 [Trichinella papuae]